MAGWPGCSVVTWTLVNPRVFPVPRSLGSWGLVVLDPWITAFGLAVQMAGTLWFLDRMALLYDDVSSAAEEVR